MGVTYDRTFAPYVIPGGVPTDTDMVPDLAWFARMGRAQAQAAVGEVVMKVTDRLPEMARRGQVGRWMNGILGTVVQPAAGRLPEGGDAGFAYRRVAGMNPMTVKRVRSADLLPPKLVLADAKLAALLGAPHSFADLLARGDLYCLDLRALRVPGGTEAQSGKFIAPAVALFAHAPQVDAPFPLVPLAIECAVGHADGDTVVVTPLDGERWKYARHMLNVADVNYTELCLHLARAHLMTAPFTISLHRNLDKRHPIYQFLLPHMRFELFVSRMAWLQGMRNANGILVRSLAGSAKWSQQVARHLWEQQTFADQHFLRDMAARGMDDAPFDYPYRDDGKLLWAAIGRFCAAFVQLTYPEQDTLQADTPLHRFLAEVQSPQGGNVRDLLPDGRLTSRDQLTELLTQIVFTAGPMHALLHYASAAELQDMEHNPGYLLANPFSHGKAALPGRRAMHQFTRVMGTNARHDKLGDFSRYELGRRADCQPMIQQFQTELRAIESTIEERNQGRFAPFVHLLPSRLCNGITV